MNPLPILPRRTLGQWFAARGIEREARRIWKPRLRFSNRLVSLLLACAEKPSGVTKLGEAAVQQPQNDLANSLARTWPGEKDDGFEASINELRHPERQCSCVKTLNDLADRTVEEAYAMDRAMGVTGDFEAVQRKFAEAEAFGRAAEILERMQHGIGAQNRDAADNGRLP